jgi:hypothetical protein
MDTEIVIRLAVTTYNQETPKRVSIPNTQQTELNDVSELSVQALTKEGAYPALILART